MKRGKRGEEPQWKEPCGCVVTSTRYIKMCGPHEKESNEIHERWAADKVRIEKERDEREAAIKEST